MVQNYHAKIGDSAQIPVPDPKPVLTFSPVVVPGKDRPVDIQMRVSVPESGSNLPIILLSHGLGTANWISSHFAYTPLSDFYAARGFVVIQPSHLDSHFLGLDNKKGYPWESRPKDMSSIIDQLDDIEKVVPTLKGRLDKSKIAVVGHSMGGQTAGMLLGQSNTDPRDGTTVEHTDPRVKTGVILAAAGRASDLAEHAKGMIPFWGPNFDAMKSPALVVYGDEDDVPLSGRGGDWFSDAYKLSPSPKALLRVKGGKHGLGGVCTWDAAGTDDESPERLGMVQKVTWAYLQSQLYNGDDAWNKVVEGIKGLEEKGTIETK